MNPIPPRIPAGIIARALSNDPAGPAILGDLYEDFVLVARTRGVPAAQRWYWREATRLSFRRVERVARRARQAFRKTAPRGPGGMMQDLFYAMRNVRSNPGFALFTAVVMGLGIGAAATVFSVMKPLVLAPLPFQDAERLVWIANQAEPGDESLAAITQRSANLYDFRLQARSFDGLTGFNAYFDHAPYVLAGMGDPQSMVGADVAHDFLDVLGVPLLHGRSFTSEEGQRDGPGAVILTHGAWQRLFGGDIDIIGDSLSLNGRPRTVVGVLPASFDFSSLFSPALQVDILLPFHVASAEETQAFQGNTMHLIGRLADGVSSESAQAELDAVLGTLEQRDPGRWGLGAVVTPLQQHIAGPFRSALLLLAAAAGAFTLLVSVNVSNLVLARAMGRSREAAVRKALGASRGRLVRQLVAETLIISLVGAVIGSLLAWQATQLVASQASVRIPMLDGVRVDGTVLLFGIGLSVLAGVLCGLFPALRLSDGSEAEVLRDGGSGMSVGRSARRLREALVVVQVSLACVLLLVTGLLVRSFEEVLATDLGFDAPSVVAWELDAGRRFETLAETSDFYARMADRVAAIGDVDSVGLIDELPLGINRSWPYRIVGSPDPFGDDNLLFPHVIDPGYIEAMKIPLRSGRNFAHTDTSETQPVVLINESGARMLFGEASPLGQRMKTWGDWEWEIVGVVADVRHVSPESDAGLQFYFPVAQMPDFHTLDMVVRSNLPVAQLADAVSAALRDAHPTMPSDEFWTVQSMVDRSMSARRFTLVVLAVFGAAALLVAGLGIYGVVAHSVVERVPEIGIRRALGAQTGTVVWGVMSRTLALVAVGTAVGIGAALASAQLLASLVYGVGTRDSATFVVSALVLVAIASLAAVIPAMRAARITGLVTLGRS